jgi:hypothetical protein
MISVISVIRVLLMRSLLRTPIAEPYVQLISDLNVTCDGMEVYFLPGFSLMATT